MLRLRIGMIVVISLHATFVAAVDGPGGPEAVTCMVRIADTSCKEKLIGAATVPANVYCTGNCTANACTNPLQHQYPPQAEWVQKVAQWTPAKAPDRGQEVATNGEVVCQTSAVCKCLESADGTGACYADLLTVTHIGITVFNPNGIGCDGAPE
jgi:hypothetical protein